MCPAHGVTRRALARHGLRLSKRRGQHLLADPRTIARICAAIPAAPSSGTILEIGPGLGALTRPLAGRCRRLIAVEVDRDLAEALRRDVAGTRHVQVVTADFLTWNWRTPRTPVTVVGAIPYALTTPILERLVALRRRVQDAYLVVQREVAQRLVAVPGSRAYSRLTCFIRYHAEVSMKCRISPGAFVPPPRVSSALVALSWLARPAVPVRDERLLFAVIAAAFGQRRKTLTNALRTASWWRDELEAAQCLRRAGLRPDVRGEAVGLAEFARLADALDASGVALGSAGRSGRVDE